MEDKIEIGEWVKLKDGSIDRIKDIIITYSDRKLIAFEKRNSYLSDLGLKKQIVKHSKNIIDLIEVGDILEIERGLYSKSKIIIEDEDTLISIQENIKKCNIKSIVTKEQFKQVQYEI